MQNIPWHSDVIVEPRWRSSFTFFSGQYLPSPHLKISISEEMGKKGPSACALGRLNVFVCVECPRGWLSECVTKCPCFCLLFANLCRTCKAI